MLTDSTDTNTYRSSILVAPTEQIIAETKVYQQSCCGLMSAARSKFNNDSSITTSDAFACSKHIIIIRIIIITKSSKSGLRLYNPDSSNEDVADECLCYSVAGGISVFSYALPTTLFVLIYIISLSYHSRK